jgi:hypothetical protein
MAKNLEFSVQFDQGQMAAIRGMLDGIKNGFAIAMQKAISRSMTTARARMARLVAKEVNLRIGDIKKQITMRRPNMRDLSGTISMRQDATVWLAQYLSSGKRLGLAARVLGMVKGKTGKTLRPGPIKVKVRMQGDNLPQWQGRMQHAFAAITPHSGHLGIFERIGVKRAMKSGRSKGKVKEVIRRMRGPSALSVFINAKGEKAATILGDTLVDLAENISKNALSAVDGILSGKRDLSRLQAITTDIE